MPIFDGSIPAKNCNKLHFNKCEIMFQISAYKGTYYCGCVFIDGP